MAFRRERTACFADGAWNVYILQPEWLSRHTDWMIPDPLNIDTLRTGPGFRYWSEVSPVRWEVTPLHVLIESRSASENVGSLLAGLLRKLPETPLTGIGSLFFYSAPERDVPNDAVGALPTQPGSEPILARGASLMVEVASVRYQLNITVHAENRQATLHAWAMPLVACDQGIDELTPHLERFDTHRQTAERLARHYWNVTFDDTDHTDLLPTSHGTDDRC